MKAKEIIKLDFLSGGGEMGELIRSFDWSKTSIGSPATWPQSLRIAVRIMLDSPFGMYIAWGKDFVQMYNDAYRPILGTTKHPHALGTSTRKTFEEIWPSIGPMFDGVMNGIPTRINDFVVQLNRNGYLEECVFNFSYSPIRLEEGEVGGVLTTVFEITETVRAVNALKESEGRFQNLIRESNVGIVVLSGEEMRVDVVNEAYGKLIEIKPEELLGKPLFEMVPDAEETFHTILNNVRLSGKSHYLYDQPYKVVTNGKAVEGYVNVVYQPYKENDGTIAGVIALCQDVTETINIRKKIEESEHRFRFVLEQSPDPIGILKGENMVLSIANEPLFKLWRIDKTAIGKPFLEILPEMKEQGFFSMLQDVYFNDKIIQGVESLAYFIRPDGTKDSMYFNFTYKPYREEDGRITGVLIIASDVTRQVKAKKQLEVSENQFRTFADSNQNLAWIANEEGYVYWYNQRWYDFSGSNFEKMKGYGWLQLNHPEHAERVNDFLKEAWKKDEEFELIFPLRRQDGEYRWFLTRTYPVKDINGIVERWIGTNTDITEQKNFTVELEKKVNERTLELQEKNLALELTNAELNSFSYIASHDLKEPLRKIQAFSKRIIETEKFSDKTQNYFNRIISAGERMQNLLDSLFEFSRADKTDLIFITCNLNALVEESINDLQEKILEKDATITINNLPILKGVSSQFTQLFTNLIENALKYSRTKVKPHIKIEGSKILGKEVNHLSAESETKYHSIKISDNGIGFEEKYTNKIFELFQRLHNKNEYSGTGVGLSIVKKIVNNHKGFITAEGKPNVGSTFTIYIPSE